MISDALLSLPKERLKRLMGVARRTFFASNQTQGVSSDCFRLGE